jgi:hypothetical protein
MSPPTFSAQGLTKIYGSGETVSLAEI